ncbi:unnamed protein product [Closterium sp. NIES-64]|nr:unnamed protein product [Closterium sp. NIES-64]
MPKKVNLLAKSTDFLELGLTGSLDSDISKLTALTYLWVQLTPHLCVIASHPSPMCECISPLTYMNLEGELFQRPLADFTPSLYNLAAIKDLRLRHLRHRQRAAAFLRWHWSVLGRFWPYRGAGVVSIPPGAPTVPMVCGSIPINPTDGECMGPWHAVHTASNPRHTPCLALDTLQPSAITAVKPIAVLPQLISTNCFLLCPTSGGADGAQVVAGYDAQQLEPRCSMYAGGADDAAGAVGQRALSNCSQSAEHGRLDLFSNPLKPYTSLKALFFHYNHFAGSILSAIASLPQLTSLGLFSNYLTDTVPIPSKSLLALDLGFNYLSGTFPKLVLMFCAGDNSCFLNSTACHTYGIVQCPAGTCAICGSAAGRRDLCFGGSCALDAAAAVSADTINSPNQPLLSMPCADNPATPMDTGSALALLNVKSALKVTFTSRNSDRPCAVLNANVNIGDTWTGVTCSPSGIVVRLSVLSDAALYSVSQPRLPAAAFVFKLLFLSHFCLFFACSCIPQAPGCHVRLLSFSFRPSPFHANMCAHRSLSSSGLTGTMHPDISMLTALTYLSVPSPTYQCPHLSVTALTYLLLPTTCHFTEPSTPAARHCIILSSLLSLSSPRAHAHLAPCAHLSLPIPFHLCLLHVPAAPPTPPLAPSFHRALRMLRVSPSHAPLQRSVQECVASQP